jgi:hypothetical protein
MSAVRLEDCRPVLSPVSAMSALTLVSGWPRRTRSHVSLEETQRVRCVRSARRLSTRSFRPLRHVRVDAGDWAVEAQRFTRFHRRDPGE